MKKHQSIQKIAENSGVSTTTVYRYLNGSQQIAPHTAEKIRQAMEHILPDSGPEEPDKTTIGEVARLAQVSTATISRVLNNSPLVHPNTREKVIRAIKELDYQPNRVARYLRKKETQLLGIMIPDITNLFFASVVKGIEETAHEQGYEVILINTNYCRQRERDCFQALVERRIEGLCFMSNYLDEDKLAWLDERQIPYIIISRSITEREDVPFINIDNVRGGLDATRYLIGLGHTRIAMVAGDFQDKASSMDRITGYKEALQEAGLEFRPQYLKEGDFTLAKGARLTRELLSLPDPPTAIFAVSDMTAIGVIQTAIKAGYEIPQDLSVVGFDNLDIAGYYNPPITTIAQPINSLGQEAARILIKIIEEKTVNPKQILLPHRLLVRKSCGPPRNG